MSRKYIFHFCFFCLFLCLATALQAQSTQPKDLSIALFEYSPNDMTARKPGSLKKDAEGRLMSIIKVRTNDPKDDLTAYEFDFGYMEDITEVRNDDREIWVYVQRGAKHITISRSGYKTIKNRDLGVTIEDGKVYELELAVAPRVIKKRMLLFNVSPTGSDALVTYKAEGDGEDYKPFGNGTVDEEGNLAKNIELGTYVYKVTSNDYYVTEGRIVLDDKPDTYIEKVRLHSRYRSVVFEVSPADSKAIITYKASDDDGGYKPLGKIDDNGRLEKSLEHGIYHYRVTSGNYHSGEGSFVLDEMAGNFIQKIVLRPNYGTISINTAADADIYIDNEKKAKGFWSEKLSPGFYNIECRKDKHRPTVESVEVEEGETKNITLKAPEPITGSLSLVSQPLDATITIDGKAVGVTPKNFSDLLIGAHKIEITKAGYKASTKTVEIKENETTECEVVLIKIAEQQTVEQKNTNSYNEHEYVDLGLPSGIKWATCNVGASAPEEYGGYYAWGEIEKKEIYSEDNSVTYGKHMNDISGDPSYDVAHAKWDNCWRIPTLVEFEELRKNCTWTWTTRNGVNGYEVTGPNGNSIFLPAAGLRKGTEFHNRGSHSYYWSGSAGNYNDEYACRLSFDSDNHYVGYSNRSRGCIIRPVYEIESKNVDVVENKHKEEETIFQMVETQPEFPGGMRALMKYLQENIKYPRISRDNKSQGRAFVRFVVNSDGSIHGAEVSKSSGDMYLDKEAIRVIEAMPKWIPGTQGGKPVSVFFTLPVVFRLK